MSIAYRCWFGATLVLEYREEEDEFCSIDRVSLTFPQVRGGHTTYWEPSVDAEGKFTEVLLGRGTNANPKASRSLRYLSVTNPARLADFRHEVMIGAIERLYVGSPEAETSYMIEGDWLRSAAKGVGKAPILGYTGGTELDLHRVWVREPKERLLRSCILGDDTPSGAIGVYSLGTNQHRLALDLCADALSFLDEERPLFARVEGQQIPALALDVHVGVWNNLLEARCSGDLARPWEVSRSEIVRSFLLSALDRTL